MLGKVRTRYVGHPDKVCRNRLWVDSDVSDIRGVTDVLRKVWKRAPWLEISRASRRGETRRPLALSYCCFGKERGSATASSLRWLIIAEPALLLTKLEACRLECKYPLLHSWKSSNIVLLEEPIYTVFQAWWICYQHRPAREASTPTLITDLFLMWCGGRITSAFYLLRSKNVYFNLVILTPKIHQLWYTWKCNE